MLTISSLLASMLGRLRDVSPQRGSALVAELEALPEIISDVLKLEAKIKVISKTLTMAHSAFSLGRTTVYPVVLKGAQKLKEVSLYTCRSVSCLWAQAWPLGINYQKHTLCSSFAK